MNTCRNHFSVRLLLVWGLFTVLSGRCVLCANTDASPAGQLRATAQVDGSGIFLDQVLEGQTAAFHLRLTDAPVVGQVTVLSRAQITELAQKQDATLSLTNWSGATQVRVARRTRQLAESELNDLLTFTLQREHVRDRGELELRFGKQWSATTVPDEPITLKLLDVPTTGVTPNFIARFELRTDRESIGTYQLPLQAHIWREVWVARSPVQRGQLLRDADLTRERRDILVLRDALTTLDTESDAFQLNENLSIGAPLTSRSLRARTLVQRGKIVEAIIQEGPLMITVKAEVLEDGAFGQTIRARNYNSRKEFRAKVQNEQTLVVPL